MNQGQLYHLSCRAARELLTDLDAGDMAQIKKHTATIRHYMDLAQTWPSEKLRGDALYHRERMEVLAGVAAHLSATLEDAAGALGVAWKNMAAQLAALSADRDLLRELSGGDATGTTTKGASTLLHSSQCPSHFEQSERPTARHSAARS